MLWQRGLGEAQLPAQWSLFVEGFMWYLHMAIQLWLSFVLLWERYRDFWE
jgi:hypothetical protein